MPCPPPADLTGRSLLPFLRGDPHQMRNRAADPSCNAAVRAMCRRLWRFAHREGDTAVNSYVTVSLAPWGPAEAFRGDGVASKRGLR
jgi:hypothetical protein